MLQCIVISISNIPNSKLVNLNKARQDLDTLKGWGVVRVGGLFQVERAGQSKESCTYKGIYIQVSELHPSKGRQENR